MAVWRGVCSLHCGCFCTALNFMCPFVYATRFIPIQTKRKYFINKCLFSVRKIISITFMFLCMPELVAPCTHRVPASRSPAHRHTRAEMSERGGARARSHTNMCLGFNGWIRINSHRAHARTYHQLAYATSIKMDRNKTNVINGETWFFFFRLIMAIIFLL